MSFGVERLYSVMRDDDLIPPFVLNRPVHAILMPLSEDRCGTAYALGTLLRRQGLLLDVDLSGSKIASQIKKAVKANADFAIIFGEDEFANGQVTIKN